MTDREREVSAEYERSLVSCGLWDVQISRGLVQEVFPWMFVEPWHQDVWSALGRALVHVDGRGGEWELIEAVALELVGAPRAELLRLHDVVPSPANAAFYVRRVREGYARRRLEVMASPDTLRGGGDLATEDLLAGVEREAARLRSFLSPAAARLPEALVGDLWEGDAPDREWLLDEWLSVGEVGLLTGPGSAGKGQLVLQLGAALACDREPLARHGGWLPAGLKVETMAPQVCADPVSVVLASWEDTAAEYLRRRARLQFRGGCAWAGDRSINDRLHVLPMRGFGALWSPGADSGRHMATVGQVTEGGHALFRYCEDVGARLLVIDPAGMAILTNENDRALVSVALDALAGWAAGAGCAVLVVAHPAKAVVGAASQYSGSTAWHASVRGLWTLRTPEKTEVDRSSAEWSYLVGLDSHRQERVALLTRYKNNYGWDGDYLTLASRGGRAGWHLVDPLPRPASRRPRVAVANGAADAADLADPFAPRPEDERV